jgi:hypothetical protein
MLYDSQQAVKRFFPEFHRIWLRFHKPVICHWTQSHYLGFGNAAGENTKYLALDKHVTDEAAVNWEPVPVPMVPRQPVAIAARQTGRLLRFFGNTHLLQSRSFSKSDYPTNSAGNQNCCELGKKH